MEVLLGLNYNIARVIQLGVAGGAGILRGPGTPDGRVPLRLAYAPMADDKPKNQDYDGIPDAEDACPDVAGIRTGVPATNGCPPLPADRDHDGVIDSQDQCPDEPVGAQPDEQKPGCPLRDSDGNGIYDTHDQCPTVHSGYNPDPAKPGCPRPDRDHDQVPDAIDACPDQPGSPSPDPKKNGCPGLVEVKGGQILIKEQVFFATNKDAVLKKSFGVLDVIAHTLQTLPQIRRIMVEGHTDNQGKPELNTELSDRRAKSVRQYLINKGVAGTRLEAKGFGPSQPIADNKNAKGRALNRRVDFKIIDPPQVSGAASEFKTPAASPPPRVAPPVKAPDAKVAQPGAKAAQPAPAAKPPKAGKHGKLGAKGTAPDAAAAPAGAVQSVPAGAVQSVPAGAVQSAPEVVPAAAKDGAPAAGKAKKPGKGKKASATKDGAPATVAP